MEEGTAVRAKSREVVCLSSSFMDPIHAYEKFRSEVSNAELEWRLYVDF